MEKSSSFRIVLFFFILTGIIACKGDPPPTPTPEKPKVGTTWTYTYYTYYTNGGIATSGTMTHKAVNEVTLGGETWLTIKDVAADTVVYYLKEKTGGLYQYTDNNSHLFLKSPATLNESYTTRNRNTVMQYTVKGVNSSLPTNIGDVIVNFYEGYIGVDLIEEIWFNANAWIVRHQVYRKHPLGLNFYKYSALFIQDIDY